MSISTLITLGLGTFSAPASMISLGFSSGQAPSLSADVQRLEVGAFVELFTLDVTPLGGGVLYWTPARPNSGEAIVFQGNTYHSVDIKAEGFNKTTQGALPRPQLSVGNADNVVGALLTAFDDLLGLQVTRIRTLYKYLDNQPDADPDAHWPVDQFRVERKVTQNKNVVVIELAAATDNEGAQIPRRQVLRSFCPLNYRRLKDGNFDYADAECPYAGAACFDKLGGATTPDGDDCGKRVRDCKLRFGSSAQLPFGGFPGAIARA